MNAAKEENEKMLAKMELISITSELMPKGAPNLTGVIKYPSIERLGQELGKKVPLLMIFTLVRDFCDSINVVRNMNEAQMMETSSMLLDECDNFRMEDYVMMFSMAKRGNLVKIFDRVDIDLVGGIMDRYWEMRNESGKRVQQQQYQEYEDKLKQIERNPNKLSLEEEVGKIDVMDKLKELTIQLCSPTSDQRQKEYQDQDERAKEHIAFFKAQLTPEQYQEIEERRLQIKKAAEEYEKEKS